MRKEKLPSEGEKWWCYTYRDSWGNNHASFHLPINMITAELLYNEKESGGTFYYLNNNQIVWTTYVDSESWCEVYTDESDIIKSVVERITLLKKKTHPRAYIYRVREFERKFPLTYRLVKYFYCCHKLSATIFENIDICEQQVRNK
jgi:hypothetical protein